jgi:hypothetical protein
MTRRKTHYKTAARPGQSLGVTAVTLPFRRLLAQFKARFVRDAVAHLAGGGAPSSPPPLEDAGLGPGTVSLDEWFVDYSPPPLSLDGTREGLLRLAESAEDLARDDGSWRDVAAELDRPAVDAVEEVARRIDGLVRRCLAREGPPAARRALEALRHQMAGAAAANAAAAWTAAQAAELYEHARQLRHLAHPRSWLARVLMRVRPDAPAWGWLSEGQRAYAERQALPAVTAAAQTRHGAEVVRRKARVYEACLGRPGVAGLLESAEQEVARREQFFQHLAAAPEAAANDYDAQPHEILLAADLDTPLGPGVRRTLGDLFDENAARAGCTPAGLAAVIAHAGLPIDGRVVPPGEWPDLAAGAVREALERLADLYLGAADPDATLDIERPATAVEWLATIHLLHPELRTLLVNVLPVWVRQSRPYAELNAVAGADPNVLTFLYCYEGHRAAWQRLLHAQVTLTTRATGPHDTLPGYAVGHPYAAVLAQFAVALAPGALRDLPAWVREGNRLRQEGEFPPPYDWTAAPELRLLPERVEDYADAEQLFDAAVQAQALVPIGDKPAAYAPAWPDPALDRLFAQHQVEASWRGPEFFARRLRRPEFATLLLTVFPEVRGLRRVLRTLARESSPLHAAEELVRLGVLEARPAELYRLARVPADGAALDPELYQSREGQYVGLSRQDFVAALCRDDELYNAVFWRVSDALDAGRVSPRDVPPSLVRVTEQTGFAAAGA